jgi:hypothetical protein
MLFFANPGATEPPEPEKNPTGSLVSSYVHTREYCGRSGTKTKLQDTHKIWAIPATTKPAHTCVKNRRLLQLKRRKNYEEKNVK